MITKFLNFLNENVLVKTGDVFSFAEILNNFNNDRKRAIPQFKRMIIGRRIKFDTTDRRGRKNENIMVPARVIVMPNNTYFKLFYTKDIHDENFVLLSFISKVEILSSVKQIFHDSLDPYGEELWEVDDDWE